jgi:predicted HAD superfamily Cof-like phosphohydrolase
MDFTSSDAEKVKQFTEESTGKKCFPRPTAMNRQECEFVVGMVMSEMSELLQTVCKSPEDVLLTMHNLVGKDFHPVPAPCDDNELIAQQADGMVDAWYYMLNAACKKGVNLSRVFNLVHEANMAKRNPTTGKFERREDGKILKPEDWHEADVVAEIVRQSTDGAFA